jgi:hypothetical protein
VKADQNEVRRFPRISFQAALTESLQTISQTSQRPLVMASQPRELIDRVGLID